MAGNRSSTRVVAESNQTGLCFIKISHQTNESMNRRFETEQYEAFEALTKALESLDRYQESQSAADLKEAENRVNEALGFDSSYLKAIYFKGITGYLNDKPLTAWNLFSSVLREAKAVNEASSPLLTEIRYNLAATTLEHARGNESLLGLAISLFQEVIDRVPSDDLVLELLSRAGAARAYAERSLTAGSEQVNEDRMTAREHCDYVEQALRQQENFLSRIIRRKRIQKDVATQIREIVRVTKDKIAESEREKSPESPSQPTSVQTETAAGAPEPEVAESPEAHPATERSGTDENPEARIEARPTWLERRHPLSGDLH